MHIIVYANDLFGALTYFLAIIINKHNKPHNWRYLQFYKKFFKINILVS